jgi:hypothetical protein
MRLFLSSWLFGVCRAGDRRWTRVRFLGWHDRASLGRTATDGACQTNEREVGS